MNGFHGHSGVTVSSDENHRRVSILRYNLIKHLPTTFAGHMIIDRDQVVALGFYQLEALVGAFSCINIETALAQRALNQPTQAGIIIYIKDLFRFYCSSTEGTWMTDRKRPN